MNWNKKDFTVEIDSSLPATAFKENLQKLTGVPANRQKILGFKGGELKDNADWNKVGLKSVKK